MPDRSWVEKELSYDNSICQFFGRKRVACAKCVEACPQDALKAGEYVIELDPELCNDCGDCVSICPSGALGMKIESRQPIGERLAECDGSVLVICERETWRERVEPDLAVEGKIPPGVEPVPVERIGVLSEVDFAEAVMASRKAVAVLALGEADQDRPFVEAARLVGEISACLFSSRMVRVFTDPETFRSGIAELAESSETMIPSPPPGPEDEGKREALRRVLKAWLDSRGGEHDEPVVISHPAYAAVACDGKKCTLCAACANQCKVRSLRVEKDENRVLYHTPIACLDCGVCVALCPEEALSSEPGLRLDSSFLSRQELARSEALHCLECGRPFSSAERSRRVSQKLLAARGEDPVRRELLRLCPECRTKKAFTTHSEWTAAR